MFRFTPQTIPSNIFVIGGGGTGSRLMPMLAQFMRSITRGVSPTGWVESPTIWIVDDDQVEQKNLLRQNFIQNDVSKPKATVLAERYGRAYDINIIPLVQRVDEGQGFKTAVTNIISARTPPVPAERGITAIETLFKSSLVIICVDSSHARRNILNNFITKGTNPGIFFIDAGNEDSFGQVNFFNAKTLYSADKYHAMNEKDKLPKLIGSVADIDFLPMDIKYYKDLVDTESTASCADLNQTLAINAMMATTIMGIVQNYYYRKPFTYNCIRLSLDGANATEFCTFNNLKRTSITYEEMNAFYGGYSTTIEKNGSVTKLAFINSCGYVELLSKLYIPLRDKIAKDAEEAKLEQIRIEKEARLAKEKLEKDENLSKIAKAVGEQNSKNMKGISVSSTKMEVKNQYNSEDPVGTTLEITFQTSILSEALPIPPSVPELTSTPRRRVPELTSTPRRRRTQALPVEQVADMLVNVAPPTTWLADVVDSTAEEATAPAVQIPVNSTGVDLMDRAIESVRNLRR